MKTLTRLGSAPEALAVVLVRNLPHYVEKGRLDEEAVARDMQVSTANVLRIVDTSQLLSRDVPALLALRDSTLTEAVLAPYVMDGPDYVPRLVDVLTENLPEHISRHRKGSIRVAAVAGALGYHAETLRKAFRRNRIFGHYVTPLCNLPGSTLTPEKLAPYVRTE
ncbi:hypothetical protein [Amorphus orientalis]|uniref:Uncharacterized protein n=1 Tax=Amorphus orientalis TaxID=649198 RepID=A0AAE3VTC8_9HYPH|nr:hypothetical protein [Amorphus orientalis]MDQ0317776.1 hypothetical protein [Amorphus orientalis]